MTTDAVEAKWFDALERWRPTLDTKKLEWYARWHLSRDAIVLTVLDPKSGWYVFKDIEYPYFLTFRELVSEMTQIQWQLEAKFDRP